MLGHYPLGRGAAVGRLKQRQFPYKDRHRSIRTAIGAYVCPNAWTDRNAGWGQTRVGPTNRVLDGGVQISRTERGTCGGTCVWCNNPITAASQHQTHCPLKRTERCDMEWDRGCLVTKVCPVEAMRPVAAITVVNSSSSSYIRLFRSWQTQLIQIIQVYK